MAKCIIAYGSPSAVKHPFAEYLPITRLAHLVTTRSNVLAMRNTVGFFEVAYRDVAIEQKPSPQPIPWRSSGGKVTAENAEGAERKGGRTEED